jgi:TMEM175 potassium channel family protein
MLEHNLNARLETFCDGVFAIAMTLLIVDVRIPSTVLITDTHQFWVSLYHVMPSILAFVLSFMIIFITWVNHHASLRSVSKRSTMFTYANGFLLLTVVFVPFPTSLLGEHLFSDHSAPAVVLYDGTLALQAVGWIFLCNAALKNQLTKNETAKTLMLADRKFAYFAFTLYSLCTIVAFWFPLLIGIVTIVSWIFWLVYGLSARRQQID